MEIKNYIHIDFTRGKDIVVPSIQYDSGTRWVMAKLYDNGLPIDLQELKVCIVAVKPDGKEIFNDCKVINAEKGIIEFEITKQMGILVGEVECQIKLFGPDQLLSSNIFKLSVTKTLSPSSESSKDELDVLVNALGEVQDIDNRFAQTNAKLLQKANEKDLIVERERINNLAKLQQGSTTGDAELADGRIGADGITYENIGSAIRQQNKKLNNSIKNLESLSDILPLSVENGRWGSDAILVKSDLWRALTYSVVEGKEYYINGYTLENATYRIIFTDNSNEIISKIEDYQTTQPLVDYKVVAPNKSTRMKITIEKKDNRIFYVKTNNTKNTESLILNTTKLTKDVISNGEVTPLQRNIDFRWGADGSLVAQVGFNAYKFNVIPGEKYYLKGYIYSYSFLDYFNSNTIKIDEEDKEYFEITIPNGIYTLLVTESNKGDGNFKLFNSTINAKTKRIENLKEYGIVNPTEIINNARWGGNDTTVAINNYNVYKYSVVGGEIFYLKGHTLKDLTSRIGFKYSDGTFGAYTNYQPQPLDFFKLTIPYNVVMMYITETDEHTSTFELYSTGIIKKTLDLVEKRLEVFNDAELIDGRIGADGVVYSNIGDAMRNQFNKVTKSIDDAETLNEIHPLSVEKGRWGADGNLVESELFFAITYLVIGGKPYYLNGHTLRDSTFKIFFVNDSDSIVSAIEDYQSSQPLVDFKLIAPNDATKMKITIENANDRVFYVTSSNTKNTSNLILNANNKIEEIINDGEIKPLQVVADNRWGSSGNLVPQVGFNAYKYSVTPNETYYIDGYEFAHGFLDEFGSYTSIASEGYKNYREISIPSGVYYLCVSESDKGDGNLKLFKSPINSRIGRAENLKKDGIVTPTEFVKNARWGGNDGAVSINNYNLYKYSVVEGEKFYLKGYTLKDRTSRIGFKYFDGTFGEHTDFQPQPLNFYEITVPKKAIMMYITETDEANGASFELYSTGIIKKTLDLVEKRLEAFNDYPSYYQDHLEDKITQYQNIKYYTDSDSFIFLTDIHYKDNEMNSVGLINGIVKNTDLRKVFSGGDLVYAYGTTEECKNSAITNVKYFNKLKDNIDFCAVRGNHDFTIKHSADGDTGYSAQYELAYNSIMSSVTDKATKTDKLYYYLDNESKKIRYVFIDTSDGGDYSEDEAWGLKYGMSEEQINWLKNTALMVDESWCVLVIGHVPCVSELNGYHPNLDTLANILKDYKNKRNEFANAKGEFIAYICGHNHKDMDIISDNTTFISTGCDAAIKDDIFDRTKGTTREQLFDIFVIDKTNRKIKTIRVGAGNNREFSY